MTRCPSGLIRITPAAPRNNARTGNCCGAKWRSRALPYTIPSGGTSTTTTGKSTRSRMCHSKRSRISDIASHVTGPGSTNLRRLFLLSSNQSYPTTPDRRTRTDGLVCLVRTPQRFCPRGVPVWRSGVRSERALPRNRDRAAGPAANAPAPAAVGGQQMDQASYRVDDRDRGKNIKRQLRSADGVVGLCGQQYREDVFNAAHLSPTNGAASAPAASHPKSPE